MLKSWKSLEFYCWKRWTGSCQATRNPAVMMIHWMRNPPPTQDHWQYTARVPDCIFDSFDSYIASDIKWPSDPLLQRKDWDCDWVSWKKFAQNLMQTDRMRAVWVSKHILMYGVVIGISKTLMYVFLGCNAGCDWCCQICINLLSRACHGKHQRGTTEYNGVQASANHQPSISPRSGSSEASTCCPLGLAVGRQGKSLRSSGLRRLSRSLNEFKGLSPLRSFKH